MARPSFDARIEDLAPLRKQVLSTRWTEGIDPREVQDYLAGLDTNRFASNTLAARSDRPLTQPRGGFPRFESQRELSLALSRSGADFIPLTIDSYTRHNEYDTALQLLQRSEHEEKDYLNGYPLVAHGHLLTRELFDGIEKPISLRHGTPDARLLVEIAIAAGITDIEGGGICYCIPYSEGFPLDRALLYWQYVDRLCAVCSSPGAIIQRESFGPLTATMVPPAIAVSIQIIEGLLAAEQGVASLTVSFGQTGSVSQDVATSNVLRKLLPEYLAEFQLGNVKHYLAYHQWMGQFPADRSNASALITTSALIASLVGADKIIVKTSDEARGVPSIAVNSEAVRNVRYVLERHSIAGSITSPAIEEETGLIEAEVRSILEAVFDLPGEFFWQSVYKAFQSGIIDVPFSPHRDNANRLISIRDRCGSIRISDPGNVPIEAANLELEKELLKSRNIPAGENYRHLLSDINLMA